MLCVYAVLSPHVCHLASSAPHSVVLRTKSKRSPLTEACKSVLDGENRLKNEHRRMKQCLAAMPVGVFDQLLLGILSCADMDVEQSQQEARLAVCTGIEHSDPFRDILRVFQVFLDAADKAYAV